MVLTNGTTVFVAAIRSSVVISRPPSAKAANIASGTIAAISAPVNCSHRAEPAPRSIACWPVGRQRGLQDLRLLLLVGQVHKEDLVEPPLAQQLWQARHVVGRDEQEALAAPFLHPGQDRPQLVNAGPAVRPALGCAGQRLRSHRSLMAPWRCDSLDGL